MSFLMRHSLSIVALLAVAGLAGCDKGSPEYRRIKDLPYSEWDKYASTLPIERRLDLHKEIMDRSGHNPQMTISESFGEDPAESYKDIVRRISSGDRSVYYLSAIYSIDRSQNFKICEHPDRKVVQDYLKCIATDAVRDVDRPEFYRC